MKHPKSNTKHDKEMKRLGGRRFQLVYATRFKHKWQKKEKKQIHRKCNRNHVRERNCWIILWKMKFGFTFTFWWNGTHGSSMGIHGISHRINQKKKMWHAVSSPLSKVNDGEIFFSREEFMASLIERIERDFRSGFHRLIIFNFRRFSPGHVLVQV